MINKLFILIKLAIKLARSDALKVASKIHKPPLVIKILVGILSISLFKKDNQSPNLSDEERLCNSMQEMGTTFIKLGQFLSTRPDIIGEKLSKQFEKLQDKLPPFSSYEANNIIKKDLNQRFNYQIDDKNKNDLFNIMNQIYTKNTSLDLRSLNMLTLKTAAPILKKYVKIKIIYQIILL